MSTQMMIDHLLKRLRLPTIGKQYRSEAEEQNSSYENFLLALLEQEAQVREENQRQARLRKASFPIRKTLDNFEFHLVPDINRNRIMTLAQGEFVERHEYILLLGNNGKGKTHLATALGLQLIQLGHRVKFITASTLVEELLVAKEEQRLIAF
jgi:DNA replication protein DnaC